MAGCLRERSSTIALVFVDANVLVYARDSSEPEKQKSAAWWIGDLWRSRNGRISYQVLREYYVTVTRKLRPGMPAEAAREDVRALMHWSPVPTDATIIERAWAVEEKFGLSFWDSLIVAAAAAVRATVLLTEDLQEGAEYDDLVVVNPFRTAPGGERIHDR